MVKGVDGIIDYEESSCIQGTRYKINGIGKNHHRRI